jgi:hypothetical protein
MVGILFIAGQMLGVLGLAHGWFLSLTYCDHADAARTVREQATFPHHLAIA